MRAARLLLAPALALLALLSPDARAGAKPAQEALAAFEQGPHPKDVVQNRFFLKAKRFEVAPVLGYVPNNPFVKRYVGGVLGAYHFSEVLAAEGALMYAPDLGETDLKGLTHTLLDIANNQASTTGSFRQPVDKMRLGATFAARWAPVYGKINLIGERVLNFDFYGTGGLGMLSIAKYYASYQENCGDGDVKECTNLTPQEPVVVVPLNVGIGMDFFVSSAIAVKIDARSYLYMDKKPDYNPDDHNPVNESRLYDTFIASAGVSVFFPKMKPRRYEF